ncbi:hypothetical protein Vadar_034739 [Vaccinium darrowii]|uniref:Uncharacterized protein n=1 Tax=Vaccinium darrowii TaxID=229202 RepID=A0ACB7YIK9_9ERIC|nr:hypothetical protein Vadar_034739 [Vaccinium darrowii]
MSALKVLARSMALCTESLPEDKEAVGSWLTPEQIEFHCFNRILSAMSDHLYDVYHSTTTTTAKELWKTLEAEYGTVDAGIERFTVSNFNGYKMKDEKPVGDQIHEFQELLRGVEKKGTTFSEEFKVVEKKHRSSVDIGNEKTAKVNLVEIEKKDSSNNRNKYKAKGKIFKNNNKGKYHRQNHYNQVHNNDNNRKEKGAGKRSCFLCGRTNHVAKYCYYKKTNEHKPRYHIGQDRKGQRGNVNMVMEEKEIAESSFRYNPEINSTFEYQDWWLDSGANVHPQLPAHAVDCSSSSPVSH